MKHKHSSIKIKLLLFEVTHQQFLPCPQSWTFEELLRVTLVLRGEFFGFSMWIFFSYSHFLWILTLCREVALRKQTCLSSMDLSSSWHLGHHWGLVLCKAVDQHSALQMSWLQWEEGVFATFWATTVSCPAHDGSSKILPYVFQWWGRTMTQGSLEGNTDICSTDCWKTWL